MDNSDEQLTEVKLRLGFDWDGTGSEEDTWNLFTDDIGNAGYSILGDGGYVNAWLDLELEMDGEDTEYFAWDLSDYHGSAQLGLSSVTVIREPSTMALLGIAGLVVLALRRRRV